MAKDLRAVYRALSDEVERLRFGPPVSCVYNPLRYARAPHEAYLARYARPGVQAVLLGMNPGPFGMAQTGVPFGEVAAVTGWLGLGDEGPIARPAREHPKRPVQGFSCARSEVSGRRLWGWAQSRFGTPARFFRRFLVLNYCPLAFLLPSGANLTPDKLGRAERERLFAACDRALAAAVAWLEPRAVVGVGAFAEGRARAALSGRELAFGRIPHPSPASPQANRGWEAQADAALAALGLGPQGAPP
ncbi:MAG TPA: single-stranded DNA-binding protein [Myxococcota bacterium]|nr:single-stranded DNA-binding protein [Myxococcota bacterium]HRY92757.1 single-stranded DNA-binding protein [Myxococcota bacterium]HSA21465.1 single-stranded DNA-binding protein [Myxococcota bacterium]